MSETEKLEDNMTAAKSVTIYPTHHGVKNHVPLCESSKSEIMRAVEASDPAKLADLLDIPAQKATINKQDWQGFTALHFASMTTTTGVKYGQADPGCIACAKLLIDNGASTDLPAFDNWNYTPLMLATMSHYPAVEVVGYLIAAGADLTALDAFGGTALHAAAYGSKVAQLKVLTTHPDFEKALTIKNRQGKTALDIALEVYKRQEEKVELAPNHCETRLLLATGKGFPGAGVKLPKGATGVDYKQTIGLVPATA